MSYPKLDKIWKDAGLDSRRCLQCDVCCRFPSPVSHSIPFFGKEEMRLEQSFFSGNGRFGGEQVLLRQIDAENFCCPCFVSSTQSCSMYDERPFDCHLYPFLLMYDKSGKNVWLAVDEVCPFVLDIQAKPEFQRAIDAVTNLLEGEEAHHVIQEPGIISVFQEQSRPLRILNAITQNVCLSRLGLARLVSTCHDSLRCFFEACPSSLSGHTFPGIYLWRDMFHLYWKEASEMLLLFAEADGIIFLIAQPLGKGDWNKAIDEATEIARAIVPSFQGFRVQEVDEQRLPVFLDAKWTVGFQSEEYIYERQSLVSLKGRKYASKRHDYNRFLARYKAEFRPYRDADFIEAVALFKKWQKQRYGRCEDNFYRAQLEDALYFHIRTLKEASMMDISGYVVTVENRIVAYTFGFPLTDGKTFAVFLEVADLEYIGLPAFIYREFCKRQTQYSYIDACSDSMLPNLKRSKISYRPYKLEVSYTLNPPTHRQVGADVRKLILP